MELIQYIWENEEVEANQLYGRWQFGDGERSQGGARSEREAFEQIYYCVQIARQHGHQIDSVQIVFGEAAPVTEHERSNDGS